MNDILNLIKTIQKNVCEVECGGIKCNNQECYFNFILNELKNISFEQNEEESQGCFICEDKKNKKRDVWYDNNRGGLSSADYCPNCGRKL